MSETYIRAGLVGVTGYTGMELTRILASHPSMKLVLATSRAEAGRRIDDIYPFMANLEGGDVVICEPDVEAIAAACDVVFLAVPHKTAMGIAEVLYQHGVRVVDLSADFRIRNADTYEAWYHVEHSCKDLIKEAVYGLPELYGNEVKDAKIIANPGCYPTSAIIGLAAALKADIVHTDDIVIDSKSGTSGAGRKAVVTSLFCEVHDSFRAYGLGKHRHTPEIEQELSVLASKNGASTDITVSFNPHLLPIDRGILSTMYLRLRSPITLDEVHALYSEFWANHQAANIDNPSGDGSAKWVRVLPKGKLPETRHVRGTMFCDLGIVVDERTNRLIIVSAIDNVCRGASGQAVANANLMFGLPVNAGLNFAPFMP